MQPRFASEQLMQQSEAIRQQIMQDAMQAKARLERQRQRDIAAAFGQFIPFTEADMRP